MTVKYIENKKHIYKYREVHREKYNEYQKHLQKRLYDFNKISKIFRNILI